MYAYIQVLSLTLLYSLSLISALLLYYYYVAETRLRAPFAEWVRQQRPLATADERRMPTAAVWFILLGDRVRCPAPLLESVLPSLAAASAAAAHGGGAAGGEATPMQGPKEDGGETADYRIVLHQLQEASATARIERWLAHTVEQIEHARAALDATQKRAEAMAGDHFAAPPRRAAPLSCWWSS